MRSEKEDVERITEDRTLRGQVDRIMSPDQKADEPTPQNDSAGKDGQDYVRHGQEPANEEARQVLENAPNQAEEMTKSVEGPHQPHRSENGKSIIETFEIKKAFGSHQVLNGVTCQIPAGEISVIMGPSGTGKSVMLRHFVGLLMPDSGDVVVDGKSVPKLSESKLLDLRRNMGMLFQDGALFSSMNLFDNVAFPLRQHTNNSEGKIREIVMARLKEVGLAGAEKKMPNELSGGMRKRAGFARALVLEPKILLFDEPDSGLDPVRTALLCELIKDIQRKYGSTAVVISHDIKAVFEIADHIVLLHGGKVVDQGPKEQLRTSDNQFTQQFIQGAVMGPLGMD
jgi:phospholipid/cholesterol/gamma-HCH transport system ATP-binding protein